MDKAGTNFKEKGVGRKWKSYGIKKTSAKLIHHSITISRGFKVGKHIMAPY